MTRNTMIMINDLGYLAGVAAAFSEVHGGDVFFDNIKKQIAERTASIFEEFDALLQQDQSK